MYVFNSSSRFGIVLPVVLFHLINFTWKCSKRKGGGKDTRNQMWELMCEKKKMKKTEMKKKKNTQSVPWILMMHLNEHICMQLPYLCIAWTFLTMFTHAMNKWNTDMNAFVVHKHCSMIFFFFHFEFSPLKESKTQ